MIAIEEPSTTLTINGRTLFNSDSERFCNRTKALSWIIKVDDKANKITKTPKPLIYFHISDCLVMIDAMGSQKKIEQKSWIKTILLRQGSLLRN